MRTVATSAHPTHANTAVMIPTCTARSLRFRAPTSS
jgi:hypothetical protein